MHFCHVTCVAWAVASRGAGGRSRPEQFLRIRHNSDHTIVLSQQEHDTRRHHFSRRAVLAGRHTTLARQDQT